ncbi:hypothetical protein [Brunnivagina elsteri]|uniref:Uncharacterized protein n=1 Tax=Brunnivagina elsteri CCALA 953 TaxID=987040 RepID=A0A2A2TBB2_9CYAN|nr:hypothetical protein [Calothrix elsteri]PAX49835.1 hypothetical protein CK510_27525 [Calothrix elsteri CCALA 953]
MESQLLNVLAIAAMLLLVAVTGGVGYLTLSDWRDRRRQEKEKLELRRSSRKRK